MLPYLTNTDTGKTLGFAIGADNVESNHLRTRTDGTLSYLVLNEANINTTNDADTVPDVDMTGSVKLMGSTISLEENKMVGSGQIDRGSTDAYEVKNSGYVAGVS